MASRISYTVSVTAVNTIPAKADDYEAHDMVDSQIGGSLAAQCSIAPTGGFVQVATLNGDTYTRSNRFVSAGVAARYFGRITSPKLVFLKNTGKAFETNGSLGDSVTTTVLLKVNGIVVAMVRPGQALAYPLSDVDLNENLDLHYITLEAPTAVGAGVAVEALILG